jgi:WD40 repeat protein
LWAEQCVSVLPTAHADTVAGLCWAPHQPHLVISGCSAGSLIAHDIRQNGGKAWQLSLHTPEWTGGVCALSALGSSVAVGCSGGVVVLVDPRAHSVLSRCVAHTDDVRGISEDGTIAQGAGAGTGAGAAPLLCTASFDGTAGVWALEGGTQESTGRSPSTRSPTRASTSTRLISRAPLRGLGGHADKVLDCAILPLPLTNGRAALTSGADGKVLLWKL